MKFSLALPTAGLAIALSSAACANQPAKPAAAAAATAPAAAATTAAPTGGRDWSKIDTNKDNHVSPEEMETWLKANPGPLKKG